MYGSLKRFNICTYMRLSRLSIFMFNVHMLHSCFIFSFLLFLFSLYLLLSHSISPFAYKHCVFSHIPARNSFDAYGSFVVIQIPLN